MEDRSEAFEFYRWHTAMYGWTYTGDRTDLDAILRARLDAEALAVPLAAFGREGGAGISQDDAAIAMELRARMALDRPPGLGGPREFAVQGYQLIGLMEHVAAVRRLARRGWRL